MLMQIAFQESGNEFAAIRIDRVLCARELRKVYPRKYNGGIFDRHVRCRETH